MQYYDVQICAKFRFKHEWFCDFVCLGVGAHAHMRAVGRVAVTLRWVAASVLEANLDELEEEVEHGYLDVNACGVCFLISIFWFSFY